MGPSMVAMIYLRACSYGGSAMITPDPLAVRVARRHQADVIFRDVPASKTHIEYADSGRISDMALMKLLEPQVGKLVKLRFRRSMEIDPNGVEWEALTEDAKLVSGRLVLHAAVAEDEVVSWAEVVVDEDRDAPTAVRVAIRYMRDSGGLVPVDGEESDEAVDDDGEGEPRTVLIDPEDLRLIEGVDDDGGPM
jgi:hypothetical protein